MKTTIFKYLIVTIFLITQFFSFLFLTIIMVNTLNDLTFNNLISGVNRLTNAVFPEKLDKYENVDWISRLREGGYIIHLRHATRSSADVVGYDYYEFITNDNDSFSTYTCLNQEGIDESKLLSWAFDFNKINFEEVYSSPSCRAVEMANILSDSKKVQIENSLLYLGAVQKSKQQSHKEDLKIFINSLDSLQRNILLVGHEWKVFPNSEFNIIDLTNNLERKQGGLSILTFDQSTNTITIHKTYSTISNFVQDSRN